MALTIEKKDGVLEITGDLIGQNINFLKSHFERLIEQKQKVIVNIENVNLMDGSSVDVFNSLHKKARKLNTSFRIMVKKNATARNLFSKAKYLVKKK